MKRGAVFLDRDGVINHNWFNSQTGEWESPIHPLDFRLRSGGLEALATLQAEGFSLFLVSNQPSAAKGKCTVADIQAVHDVFASLLSSAGIGFTKFYYALSHPNAVIHGMKEPAYERKPSPHFILRAMQEYSFEAKVCWMIGDRDSDVECGQNAGVRTIQVESSEPDGKAGAASPDFRANDLMQAAEIVLEKH